MEMLKYGIDLGTTNSSVAACEGSDITVFQTRDLMNVVPSVVRILKSGRRIVGQRAAQSWAEDESNTEKEFKRLMGKKDRVSFEAAGLELSPEELSAEVLKALAENVQVRTGSHVESAVITVPAAFGTAQCEATARAARLAGLEEVVLLQEPIAAAMAYGVDPRAEGHRWVVFDWGGGTLDVAVVSTRGGELTVLEHRGDNHLGGQDIDLLIANRFLLPQIQARFSVGTIPRRLRRELLAKAEDAKIGLSTAEQVVAEIYDVGLDDRGKAIEAELVIRRDEFEAAIMPVIQECCGKVTEAISASGVGPEDLERVILVGGPTQMPLLRAELGKCCGCPLEQRIDPMTVVARGAALFAGSRPRRNNAVAPGSKPGELEVRLAFEAVSSELETVVAGRFEDKRDVPDPAEVRIDSTDGVWSSGWVPVGSRGLFEVEVQLNEGSVTEYWIYARDRVGKLLTVGQGQFSIRHGLSIGAPPLPHTMSVELTEEGRRTKLQPIIEKGAPLPAEGRVKCRAEHAVRRDDPHSALHVKLFEGEMLSDPGANELVGIMTIAPHALRRDLRTNAEVELSIKVDVSRCVSVEAFIPDLNEVFDEQIYIPERDQRSYEEMASELGGGLEDCRERLNRLRAECDDENSCRADSVEEEINAVEEELQESAGGEDTVEDARRRVERVRHIRGRVAEIEERAETGQDGRACVREANESADLAEEVVQNCGGPDDQRQLTLLRNRLQAAEESGSDARVRRAGEELDGLRWRLLFEQPWFWRNVFEDMRDRGRAWLNNSAAQHWLARGNRAIEQGDVEGLRESVTNLWKLVSPSEAEQDRQRALRSGLKRY